MLPVDDETRAPAVAQERLPAIDLNRDAILLDVDGTIVDIAPEQAKTVREYLLRGGFLMVDDFHGTYEWEIFMASMSRIFPDRPVVEIEDGDPIFHVLYDIPARENRLQVPGLQYLYSHKIYEKDGKIPHWRAIYDDEHRIMVAMTFNQDHGDAFEHADNPQYETKYTTQAYRTGINYIVYAMTH